MMRQENVVIDIRTPLIQHQNGDDSDLRISILNKLKSTARFIGSNTPLLSKIYVQDIMRFYAAYLIYTKLAQNDNTDGQTQSGYYFVFAGPAVTAAIDTAYHRISQQRKAAIQQMDNDDVKKRAKRALKKIDKHHRAYRAGIETLDKAFEISLFELLTGDYFNFIDVEDPSQSAIATGIALGMSVLLSAAEIMKIYDTPSVIIKNPIYRAIAPVTNALGDAVIGGGVAELALSTLSEIEVGENPLVELDEEQILMGSGIFAALVMVGSLVANVKENELAQHGLHTFLEWIASPVLLTMLIWDLSTSANNDTLSPFNALGTPIIMTLLMSVLFGYDMLQHYRHHQHQQAQHVADHFSDNDDNDDLSLSSALGSMEKGEDASSISIDDAQAENTTIIFDENDVIGENSLEKPEKAENTQLAQSIEKDQDVKKAESPKEPQKLEPQEALKLEEVKNEVKKQPEIKSKIYHSAAGTLFSLPRNSAAGSTALTQSNANPQVTDSQSVNDQSENQDSMRRKSK